MTYYTKIKGSDAVRQVKKEEARRLLTGYWTEGCLRDIFGNDRMFRLWTTFSEVWSKDAEGNVMEAFGIEQ